MHHKKDFRESVLLENKGEKIFGIFHRPAQQGKFPAILICHGLGGHKVGKYRLYVQVANYLAGQGIATLRIDFRGSGDSEGDFSEMTLDGEVSDAIKAIDFLKNHPHVDVDRMGIMGRSLGGLVAITAAAQVKIIKSLCLWAPIFDASQWLPKWQQLHTKGLHESQKEELMTVDGQKPGYEFYKQFFSFKVEDQLKEIASNPLFILHGCKDEVVPVHHSQKYADTRVKALGKTKVIQLPESDHDFAPLHERQVAIKETSDWFTNTL